MTFNFMVNMFPTRGRYFSVIMNAARGGTSRLAEVHKFTQMRLIYIFTCKFLVVFLCVEVTFLRPTKCQIL